ncbi:hypothetical protein D3C80_1088200 [compost metagenome]
MDVLATFGQVAGLGGRQLVQVNVGAAADPRGKGKHQADDQGDGGQDFEVDHRFQADAPDLFQVAGTGDAADHHAEHDQPDQHLDQLDEAVTEGFELQGNFRKAQAAGYA